MGKPKESKNVFEKSSSNLSSHGGINKQQLKEYKEKKQLEKIKCAIKRRPSFRQCVPSGRFLEKEDVKVVPETKKIQFSKELIAEITENKVIFQKTPTKVLIAKARLEIANALGKKETSAKKRALFTRSLAIDLSF